MQEKGFSRLPEKFGQLEETQKFFPFCPNWAFWKKGEKVLLGCSKKYRQFENFMLLDDFKQIIRLKKAFITAQKIRPMLKKVQNFFPGQPKIEVNLQKTRENVPRCLKILGRTENVYSGCPTKKNPLHLPPIIVLSYMKESMLATTSIELRNMRQIKKRF